jgi:hypothetical protein
MNRSSRKAAAADASGSRARQLLHAFADAGQQSAAVLRLHVGPNGVLVWSEAAQVHRPEPYTSAVVTVPKRSAPLVDAQSISLEEPAETSVYTSLEAPAYS